ncbi:MAG: T9SS type A sorting domain-containing protein, partial [Bacteroidales bacterium]|nr:T9SS type A sorting domain-containing protein [Bacteroidales bacterium]
INYGTHNVVTETACESFTWTNGDGQTYTTSGTYTHEYTNNDGCASVDTLHLTIYHGTHNAVTETACESFTWTNGDGQTYTTSGTYTHDYTSADGCASVDTLHLTINYGTHNVVTETACESFTWTNGDGQTYTTSGTYTHEYTNNDGCPSVDTLKLTINYGTHNVVTEIACESFTWTNGDGQTYTTSGTYTHEYTNNDGCPSVDTLKLTINYGTHNVETETACESFTWTNGDGQTYTTSGTYTHEYTNNDGCPSVDTLKLTINYGTHNVVTETACESFTWTNGDGQTYTTSGTYTHEYTNNDGCASVDTLHLTINHGTHNVETETVCGSLVWHGQTYTTSGTYTYNYTNTSGCPSVDTLKLTVNPTYAVTDIKNVCPSDMPYTWNGITFNAAGTHTVTLETINGCDSVVTMILSVNQTPITHESRTICESELPYEWNGITFNTFGANTAILQGENGCDSTVIMTLNVIPSFRVTDTRTICQSELPYTWNNVVFNATDTQRVTLQAVNGCDSVVTMILIVNPTYNITETKSVCPSEMPYTWNGITFNNAGIQTVTLQTANGCDSVVTMMLTINQTHITNESRTICESELPYEWNGIIFNTFGANTATLQDENGCDSTVIMTLNVNSTVSTEFTIETAENCYTWNEQTYCQSGDYVQTFMAANGCDSLVTLHLTTGVGINDYSLNITMTVYPNPTTGILNVEFVKGNNLWVPDMLQIFDASGKLVETVTMADLEDSPTQTTQINMSGLANGVYFLKAIKEGQMVAIRKIVKN